MISAQITTRPQFYDLDPMQIVWHGNYAKYFEQARVALFDKIGYSYEKMRDSGYIYPIIDLRVRYVKSIHLAQLIAVTATLTEYENRIVVRYLISDAANGERLTKGQTIQVAIDMSTNEMLFETPDILQDKIKALL